VDDVRNVADSARAPDEHEPGPDLASLGLHRCAFVLAGPDSGALEVSVDGSDWRRVELYHSFSKGLNYPRTVILADDLAGSYHTAAIRTAEEKPAGSEGNAATILFFGVNE
jgi:hypothetical protein